LIIEPSPGWMEATGAPMFCVRRSTLDSLLVEAAAEATVDFRPATAVTGLLMDGPRVTGVETSAGPIMASLVVGADGPHSAVSRMVGSREYHVTAPGRLFMWGYFEGADNPPPRIWLGKSGDVAMLAAPTDGELFLVAIVPSLADKARCLADTSAALMAGLIHFKEVAGIVAPARLVGPVRTMARWHGYFREATGPGWVLAGDAGHFKDPTPGQGIADAFRQVEHLAPAIVAGLSDGTLDQRLQAWAKWRDEDAWEMYWFAAQIGAPGPTSPLVREMIRQVTNRPGGADRFLQIFDHALPPSQLFTPMRALMAGLSLVANRTASPRLVLHQLKGIIGEDASHRRQRREPHYHALETRIEPDRTPEPVSSSRNRLSQ
jgi:flavin-dependent dehydrogenase